MAENNPIAAIADSVRDLAEGVGKLVQRIVTLEGSSKDHESRLKNLESKNGSQASE